MPFALSVAVRAVLSQGVSSAASGAATVLRYAQAERRSFPLLVSKCTNVVWNDLDRIQYDR